MKAAIRFIPVVLVAALATTAFGQITPGDSGSYPSQSIIESPHNLNTFPGVDLPGNQVCIPCHTPHNALLYGDENVLWNHAETEVNFTMYTNTGDNQPEGPSKKCLSCHDGVTAIDNYGGNGGTGKTIEGAKALGEDLSNDHPIGIVYPTELTNEFKNPNTFALGVGGGTGVQLVTVNEIANRVECVSCHNVHNNGLGSFLRAPLQESYICLQCHIK